MARRYYDPSGTVAEKGGPLVRYHTSSFDGSEQPYAVYVPAAYTPERQWPLFISLHGYSSDHVLNLRRVFGMGNALGEDGEEYKKHFPAFPEIDFMVAGPYGFGSVGYAGMGEIDVLDVLEDVKRHYSIDEDRVYLTGLSMGGEGTWHLGLRYPHLWAALAPVCAPTSMFIGPDDVRRFAENALYLPALVSHGAEDPAVPVACSREMVSLLRGFGTQVEYEEYPGVGHDAWNHAYAGARIFGRLSQFRRVCRPRRVVYVTDCLRYSRAYWVEIARISEWGRTARIEAEAAGDNTIEVSTDNVSAFALHLLEAPVEPDRPVCVKCNDGLTLGTIAGEDGKVEVELRVKPSASLLKRRGLEGPVFDAFRSRYAVVYGTGEEDRALLEGIRSAADRSAAISEWADVEIPVLADHQVGDAEISSMNLVLVGDDRSNSIIRRINDGLPVRFTSDGVISGREKFPADAGFVEVYPNPFYAERYVVVLGGRTPEILKKAAEIYRCVPDYAVFDGETSLAEGYFDEGWEMRA